MKHITTAIMLVLIGAGSTQAAIMDVEAVDITPSNAGTPNNVNSTLNSITVDSVTYSDLMMPSTVTAPSTAGTPFGPASGTAPASFSDAFTDFDIGTGSANHGEGAQFDFGVAAIVSDTLFFTLTANDPIARVFGIDAGGTVITEQLFVGGSSTDLVAYQYAPDDPTGSSDFVTGRAWRASDFVFTGGNDVDDLSGIESDQNSNRDATMVGIANFVIPEPASGALLALAGIMLLRRRRSGNRD